MGGAGRGIMSIAILASMVLMYLGYSHAESDFYWGRTPGSVGINNLLMLLAIYLMVAAATKSWITASIRHPQLTAIKSWAVGHLLVNGDLASILLFGGLGLWAGVQILLINGHEGPWERPMPGNALQDWKLALASLFLFVVISGIHWLFNHNPFLGTYP